MTNRGADRSLRPSHHPRTGPRIPVSTYRLQFNRAFAFRDARDVVSYLAALGITDCYCSPPFTSRPGSTHGYDIGNHNELSPDLGGEAEYIEFTAELAARGMGQILDFVPNHMSNDPRTNEWWRDVLENGPSSPYACFFDIDWDPVKPELRDKLLLPILAKQYGEALEGGELQLRFEEGALWLGYLEHRLPINPRQSPRVFGQGVEALGAALGENDPQLREFLSILTALRNLPPYTERDQQRIAERHREKEVARERLARLVQVSASIREHIDAAIRTFNGTPGDPASFDGLHGLLELQAYRLASWRTASDEVNYRRFFDINELVGLCVENPAVFEHIHELVLRLIRERKVTGLRLDHIDGLFDPVAYLERLRDAARLALGAGEGGEASATSAETQGTASGGGAARPLYVIVEKILSSDESVPKDWPMEGTTGYDFLNDLNGVFVDSRNARSMQRLYARFTGHSEPFPQVAYASKRVIILTAMTSELHVLAHAINRLSERDRRSRDFTLGSIRRALVEVAACFPVYRTYLSAASATASDRAVIEAAIRAARQRNPAMEPSVFDFLRETLLPERAGQRSNTQGDQLLYRQRLDVAMKFQQYTAPVQAKGIEDTAFYRYNVLLSLNEIGGNPQRFGRSVAEFHDANARRLAQRPFEMIATATHDAKRGEDARARLNVLSEIPDEWRQAVARWMRINAAGRAHLNGEPAPDANDEYHFYQTLLGAWPAEREDLPVPQKAPPDVVERLCAYMSKAIKEAKIHTSWISESRAYESAVAAFVERALAGGGASKFLASFVPFARRVARLGMINSLAQLVLRIVSPGVADFYQGTELWDLTLVDPDNRRPVDYVRRRAWLDELEPRLACAAVDAPPGNDDGLVRGVATMLDEWPDGRIKLFVTACGLRLRRARPALFLQGDYLPVTAEGLGAEHVVSCVRQRGQDLILAVAPRLVARLTAGAPRLPTGAQAWADTRLPLPDICRGHAFRHLLTGERVRPVEGPHGSWVLVATALATCPVALLWAEPS